ncbi:MAG: hypothetical protein EGR34_02080 [Prevotella sp.]|nr:hypothetical protein [Prevotella sp.]
MEGNGYSFNSSSNLHVLVPTVLSANGTRTDDASGLPTYNATVDECQINDLRLYAFPVDGNGKLVAENLPAPLASMMADDGIATYQLNITPGKYHIYVVANINKVLSGQTIQTEDALKNIVLDYRPTSPIGGMPVCTNIPMIYEPEKDATGKLAETVITAAGDKYTEVAADLKFTCVKVKLNLIFDPSKAEVATNFGGKTFSINNISAEKLSPFTHLYWGGKFETPTWPNNEDKEAYKKGIPNTLYDSQTSETLVYYNDWSDNRSASATNNNDDIKGTGTVTENPVNAAGKWLFQQTYYLPERYISSESDRSYLTINGKVGGSVDNNYRIDLGHKKDGTSATEVPVFPRGTFYEITGAIKTLGNMELDCKVSVKDWTPREIDADFNHTTLWVSKTEANVTSMKNDYITYNSNAAIKFGCDKQINSNDIIICKERGKDANGNDSIEFRVNPDIPISAYAEKERKGTAKVWLQANNLKKYIDVNYDVTPYLDVTKELVIYYNSKDAEQNKRTIKWDTNLGGIVLDRITDTNTITDTKGNSTIKMSLASSDAATGTFMVTATKDPVTTTIHEFTVKSKDGSMSQPVRVTVSPPIDDYRIYFRAINDRSKYTGGNSSDNFKGILAEGGTNNWSDGWNEDANDKSAKPDNHRIYVYTQIGETEDEVTGKGWIFTEGPADKNGWPGEEMVADETNTGWYYKDFTQNAQSVSNTNGSEGKRTITPGETLIMFSNNTYLDQGYSLHRCPHHLEPGIPLFDYEDREGWIVYDPTSDPIWHVYDDMPEIEDIEIKVYTQEQTWGWYKDYGIADGSNQFKINDPSDSGSDKGNSWTCKKVGNGWWKTVIKLKAIKGEHNKDIRIHLKDTKILLFDGNSYEKYGDTGYYQGDKWHQGTPVGVNE